MKKRLLILTIVVSLVGCGGGTSTDNGEDEGQNGGSQ